MKGLRQLRWLLVACSQYRQGKVSALGHGERAWLGGRGQVSGPGSDDQRVY